MRTLKASFLFSTILLLSFLVVFAQKTANHASPKHWLAVEVGLSTPMTINAGTTEQAPKAFWRLPAAANGGSSAAAIKLVPKMVGDKMEVTVSVLSGDVSQVRSCKDWGLLKESQVGSYTLREGEAVTVSQLPDLGANFKNGKLTFKAVPAPKPLPGDFGRICSSSCGENSCQANEGHCVSCPPCGELCC
jgi:hypothetical protein